MKKSKLIFAFILLLSIISNFVLTSSLNVKAIEMDEYLISKSKKATPLDENLQTTVTLSLPSVDESSCINCVDILFVMDKSTSTSNANINFSTQVKELVDKLKEKNLSVKIGIIKFRGTATDAISDTTSGQYSKLVRYDDNTASFIEDAINATPKGSGSNVHAGLQLAKKWLEEDKEVADNKKNIVLLTDGKSYIWNDDEGNAITNYAQYPTKNVVQNSGIPTANQNQLKDKYDWYSAFYKKFGNLVWFTKSDLSGTGISIDFDTLYNSTNEELSKTTKYDTKIDWDNWTWANLPGTAEKVKITDNPNGYIGEFYKFTPDASLDSSIAWYETNPFEYVENEDGTISYTDTPNENYLYYHPSNLEKGIYKAAHLYDELNEKYIMSVIYPAKNPASGALSLLADQFNYWMADVSENSSPVEENYTKIFDNIENDSVHLITKGIVTDVIGKDFDLVMNDNPFTLTVDDEVLTSTKIEENVWGFGTKDAEGNYPYKVTYNPEKEEFVWDISVPVDVIKRVKLSYTLELKNVPTEEGTYLFDTNEKACLKYTSIYSDDNPEECFEKPKVEYVVEPVIEYTDIEVTKVWEDNSNNDGKRPDSVTINLLKDGKEKVDSITLSKDTWKGTFKDVPKSKGKEVYKYTISEEAIEGYETSVKGSVEEGFVVTNKHADELRSVNVVKYWMDTTENNNRPKDIVIHLLADGVEVDSVTLSGDESEKWEYVFTDKPVYKAGKEIKYTISEDVVEGYEEPVYETEEDTLVVKNIFDTSKGGEEVDPSPKTGDSIVQMIVTLFVSMIGLAMSIFVYKKENN